jgi:PAS domain S-box-containing protein
VEALRESQRMLSSLLQNLPGIAYRMLIDPHWTVEFISAGCFKLTGYTVADLLYNRRVSYEELTHPDDRARVRQKIMAALNARRPFDVLYRLITAEGSERWVWERGQGIADENGDLRFVEGFLTDVTERRRTEEQVKAQAALLDKARDAILVIDLQGRVLYCNQSAHELFGWDASGSCALSIHGIFPQDSDAFAAARRAVLADGEWSGELAALGTGGSALTLESRWTLVRDADGTPKSILLLNTDVTERNKLEAQFLRAQRMDSLGTLAGGIAHDLNNVLAPILTSLELLRPRLSQREDHELIDILEASANRGAEMVKQILTFARGAEGQRAPLQVREILRDLEKIIRETFPRSLSIRIHAARDLWSILGDATQLHQVLLNLCVNARDAMPECGTLILRATNLADGENRQIVLEVSDTGPGIPPDIREKIFDPFFTTKEVGKGTGLGLSTAQAIIKSHGGSISVRQENGEGSTFRILLPAIVPKPTAATDDSEHELPRGRGELVLVVDDESGIRAVTQRMLQDFGYRVMVAVHGSDGLAIFRKNQGEIAAVITDLMMPVMDGPTLIRELRSLAPALPIMAVTGLAAHDNLTRAREAGAGAFLSKPYTAEILLRALSSLLAGGNSADPGAARPIF